MQLKIFNASAEFKLTGFDFVDLAESGRYGVYYRRQLHNNYPVYRILSALFRHKFVGCKSRYSEYCPFYTVQVCKFVASKYGTCF